MVLNELIFYSPYWSQRELMVTVERTAFLTVSTLGGCGGLERTDFSQFLNVRKVCDGLE